jgi:hypothetical protein
MTGAGRRDADYRKRLKRDRRSAVVVLSAIAAVLVAIVAWFLIAFTNDTVADTRAAPAYWIVMLPFAYWAVQLASYADRPIQWLRPTLYGAPAVAGAALGVAIWNDLSVVKDCAALSAICLVATATGICFFRGSMINPDWTDSVAAGIDRQNGKPGA